MVRDYLQVSATLPMVFIEQEAFVLLVTPKNIIFYIASNGYVPILNTEWRRYIMLFLMGVGVQSEYTVHVCACVNYAWIICRRLRLKCVGTRAETRFHLSAKWTSPFKSVGASVQSTNGSRGVRISGNNAGYTMFRDSVKGTGYPLHSPFSPSLPLLCVTVCHHISSALHTPFASPSHGTKCLYWALQIIVLKCSVLATVQERVITYERDQRYLKIDKTFQVDLKKATFLLHFSISIALMSYYNGYA